jgi:hypothetical protein
MTKNIEYHEKYSLLPESAYRAEQIGEIYYFTGKRCHKNHLSPRYTSSSNCVECALEKKQIVIKNERSGKKIRNKQDQILAEKAYEKGLTTYESTKQCKKGHFTRFITTNNCKICCDEKQQSIKNEKKWKRIKQKYNLSKEDYFYNLKNQDFKCFICFVDLNEKNTHVDHCHTTGKFRSLLCGRCNQGIGLFDENYEKIKKAANYVLSFQKGEKM